MSIGASGGNFEEINVTPLTDVFLVLLVIMMLIAPLLDKSDLKIKPAETRNAKKNDDSRGIIIDIDKEGNIDFNGKIVAKNATPEDLQRMMKTIQKSVGTEDVVCTVNADGESRQKDVVAMMSAAAAVGIKRMRIATLQSNAPAQ